MFGKKQRTGTLKKSWSEPVDGVIYMGVPGWTQTEYGTLIPPPGDFMRIVSTDNVQIISLSGKDKITCQYCGQWGEPFTECGHCGAPMR